MALLAPESAVPSTLVALVVLRVPAWACLLCFTSYKERLRICQIFSGVEGPEREKCEKAFTAAFQGLLDTEISEKTPVVFQGPGGHAEGGTREARETQRDTQTQVDRDRGADPESGEERLERGSDPEKEG